MQFSLQCCINSFCCFQAVPLPSPLLLLSGRLTRELLAGQFRGFYCNQEDFSVLAAGERTQVLTFHFLGKHRGQKGAGFAHQCSRVLRGAPALGSTGIPTLGQPRAGRFPTEGPYDAAKTLTKPISRRKSKPGRQQPRQPNTEQAAFESWAISTRQIYLDSTEKLWCLLIPHLGFFFFK